jgi:hypothetical protein
MTHGKPEVFNSDQGSQFTSDVFTDVLKREAIAISMDGRGQRGFKSKAVPSVYALIDLFQHEAASFKRSLLRIKRSQGRSDQISVDKTQRLGFRRQKVAGNCGSPAPLVRAMMMIF